MLAMDDRLRRFCLPADPELLGVAVCVSCFCLPDGPEELLGGVGVAMRKPCFKEATSSFLFRPPTD